jgi:hypothetical protein
VDEIKKIKEVKPYVGKVIRYKTSSRIIEGVLVFNDNRYCIYPHTDSLNHCEVEYKYFVLRELLHDERTDKIFIFDKYDDFIWRLTYNV